MTIIPTVTYLDACYRSVSQPVVFCLSKNEERNFQRKSTRKLTSSSLVAVFTESMLCDNANGAIGTICPIGLSMLMVDETATTAVPVGGVVMVDDVGVGVCDCCLSSCC